MVDQKKLDIALLILRVGLALVFLLFGFQKLSSPSQTTAEIQLLLSFLGLAAASAMNFYLGLTEVTVALALLLGVRVKIFGLLAALLTASFFGSFLMSFGLSINPDLYRDVGLTAIGLALFFAGAGKYSWDAKRSQPQAQQ